MMFGTMQPTSCAINRTSGTALLLARWPSAASNTAMNGCTFNCDGGTCRVRGGDALPVELMEFGIEDDDGRDTEELEDEPETSDNNRPG